MVKIFKFQPNCQHDWNFDKFHILQEDHVVKNLEFEQNFQHNSNFLILPNNMFNGWSKSLNLSTSYYTKYVPKYVHKMYY